MGTRRRTTNVTTIVNVNLPSAPPAQQAITAGRISGAPDIASIGSTRLVSSTPDLPSVAVKYAQPLNAWNTIPFVAQLQSPIAPQRPAVTSSSDAALDIQTARAYREQLCTDLLDDDSAALQSMNIVGNGEGTRFRFTERGAPSNVSVYNNTTSSPVSGGFTIQLVADSFSWLIFDTAPADGASLTVSFSVGDPSMINRISAQSWLAWTESATAIENRLTTIKQTTSTTPNITRWGSAASWRISDPTLVDDAIAATRDLKSALKKPGQSLSLTQISGLCTFLDQQMARIDGNLAKTQVIDNIRPSTGVATTGLANTSDAGRIYENDIRYAYMQGRADAATYSPPNVAPKVAAPTVVYKQAVDPRTNRRFFARSSVRDNSITGLLFGRAFR